MPDENALVEKIRDVAEHMADWAYSVEHHGHGHDSHHMEHGSGARLHCSMPYPHRRLTFVGVFPQEPGRSFRPYTGNHHATVAPERDSGAIAKDIARRLIPGYLIAYEGSLAEKAAYIVNLQEQAEVVHALADALCAKVSPGRSEIHVPSSINASGTFRVSLSGDVELRRLSSLTLEQALGICRILRRDV